LSLTLVACGRSPQPETEAPVVWPEIRGYQAMVVPADNPMTPAKVELGKQLYYDNRLSGDGSRSCYSCHLEENGLTDGRPTAIGAYNVALTRASPTLWNIGYHSQFYWDGRSATMEAQARAAWAGGNMGVTGQDGKPSVNDIAARLNQIPGYRSQFQAVFGQDATPENIVMAITAFERTIVANDSAWIRFREGNESALSEEARRGYQLFTGKAQCANCHAGLLLTDLQYHNVGIGMRAANPDLGRFRATQNPADRGAFKTPTLMDVSKSAPYFHDGSVVTLEEAVDLMLRGGIANPDLDRTNLQPVTLTATERADLLAFLRSLNAEYNVTQPTLPQ
jgi:cytochrome c peroxidase